jgi:hypothetical protein
MTSLLSSLWTSSFSCERTAGVPVEVYETVTADSEDAE